MSERMPTKAADSPRYCRICDGYGDHHVDRHTEMTSEGRTASTDEALVAKLTNAIGRVDSGSVGGYAFRQHVAKTDLLPLVKVLLATERQAIARSIREEAVDEAIDGQVAITAVIRMCEEAGR